MPLLGDEIFVKRSHPDLISTNPDSRFIYFPLTDELFEKHEDYFERYIQCFSDVWTCQYTKSSNLTFEGAMRSEENFLKNQSKIPRCFHLPILLLVHHMKPENSLRKLASKINFVLSLFYFKGETVGFRKFAQNERNAGIRFNIEALSFDRDFLNKSRTQSSDNNNCEGQSDQISSDDCAIDNQLMNDFRYSIEYKLLSSNNVSETASMKMIKTKDRHANYYNVDSIMIFLKDYIQFHNQEYNKSIACVKPHVIQEYRLDDPEVFVTNFPFRSPSILNKIVELCPENLELTRPFDLPVNPSPKKTNRHAETAQNSESSKSIIQKSIAVLAEEEKLRKQKEAEEKKQALQAAKILEARRREELIIKEKRLKEDYVRHLNIPREDFLSEDLRPFEKSVTIETEEGSKVDEHVPIISDMNHWKSSRLSEDQFLSVLEISEFINLFSPVLNDMFFQNFPSGIDLSLIESCILSKSPDSSYGEILQMLLSTVSNLQKLDSSNIQIECNYDLLQDLDESDPITTVCTQAIDNIGTSKELYGLDVNNLVLDNCTITEVLRQHLLIGGSANFNCNRSFLARQKGCIQFRDDPSIEFKLDYPHVVEFLSRNLVYELDTGEKLAILQMLMHQLMLTTTFRENILACNNLYNETRAKIRNMTAMEQNVLKIETQQAQAQLLAKQPKISESIDENTTDQKDNDSINEKAIAEQEEAFSKQITTRSSRMDPFEIYEKLCADQSKEFSHSKCAFLLNHFREERNQLLASCIQNNSALRSVLLGIDRYFRLYFLSSFYQGILVINPLVCRERLTDVTEYYSGVLEDPNLLKSIKQNYGIDMQNSFLTSSKHMTLAQTIFKHLEHPKGLELPLFSVIRSLEDINLLIRKLSQNGKREKMLNNSFIIHQDLISVMVNTPLPGREQSESFITRSAIPIIEETKSMKNEDLSEVKEDLSNSNIHNSPTADDQIINATEDQNPTLKDDMSRGQGLVVYDILIAVIDLCEKLHSGHVLAINKSIDLLGLLLNYPETVLHAIFDSNNFVRESIGSSRSELLALWTEKNADTQFNFTTLLNNLKDFLLKIVDIIDPDFLIEPLGLSDSKKKKSNKKLLSSSGKTDKILIGTTKVTSRSPFYDKFIKALSQCSSFAQLSLFFSILENSIAWSRSAINKSCYQCRRKIYQPSSHSLTQQSPNQNKILDIADNSGGGSNRNVDILSKMMICNICGRTYHLGCVKNPRGPLATSEWFCSMCRSQVVMHSSPAKQAPRDNQQEGNGLKFNGETVNNSHLIEDSSSNDSDNIEFDNYLPKRNSKIRKTYDAADSPNQPSLNIYNFSKPTRASVSAAKDVLKRIIVELMELNEHSILLEAIKRQQKQVKLTFEEIKLRLDNSQYNRPSQIVDDITLVIDQFQASFSHDSHEAMIVLSLENKFKDLMTSWDLTYFLD